MPATSAGSATKLTAKLHSSTAVRGCNDSIKISRKVNGNFTQSLSVSFQRTVRVSDNGATNELPPSLGAFSLYATAAFAQSLPQQMVAKGGYFFPMYRK